LRFLQKIVSRAQMTRQAALETGRRKKTAHDAGVRKSMERNVHMFSTRQYGVRKELQREGIREKRLEEVYGWSEKPEGGGPISREEKAASKKNWERV